MPSCLWLPCSKCVLHSYIKQDKAELFMVTWPPMWHIDHPERLNMCLLFRAHFMSIQNIKTFAWCLTQDGCFSPGWERFLGRSPFLSVHVDRCLLCSLLLLRGLETIWRCHAILTNLASPWKCTGHFKTAAVPKTESVEQEKGPVNEFNCRKENGRQRSFVPVECEGKAGWKKSSQDQSEWGGIGRERERTSGTFCFLTK